MMPAAWARGSRVLSIPYTTSAIGWLRVRISLLSISPALPPLTICSLTPAFFSNCASVSLGRLKESCVMTRNVTCCWADASSADRAPDRASKAIEKEKNRRCMQSPLVKYVTRVTS